MDFLSNKKFLYRGTESYMCPAKQKASKTKKKLDFVENLKSDMFSFSVSIIEMGNLLNIRQVELCKDEDVLKYEMKKFGKQYPIILKMLKPFLHWDINKRKTCSEVFNHKILIKRKRRKTIAKNQAFSFINEKEEV